MKLIIDIPEKEYQYIINEGFLERTHGKMCYKAIKKAIPIPDNKPKTGHWIPHVNGIWIEYYKCSKCGKVHDTQSDYCEKCGIRMIEPQDKDIIWYDKRNYSEIVVKPQESEG